MRKNVQVQSRRQVLIPNFGGGGRGGEGWGGGWVGEARQPEEEIGGGYNVKYRKKRAIQR